MKKAFTLAEILIALGIIGVVASLVTPAVVRLRPDNNKITYLKIYDTLSDSIRRLSSNNILFPACQDNIYCQKHPLINTSGRAMRNGYIIPEGNTKFCRLLAEEITTYRQDTIEAACSNMEGYVYSDDSFLERSMHTRRNQDYIITTSLTKGAQIEYQTDIYFDINGDKEPNCIYSEECREPDRFKLMVAADGTVIPADAAGQRYIIERKNLQKMPLEIAEGAVAVEDSLIDRLRRFAAVPCYENDAAGDNAAAGGGDNPGGGHSGNGGNNDSSSSNNEPEPIETLMCGDTYNGRIINCYYYAGDDVEFKLTNGDTTTSSKVAFRFPVASPIQIFRHFYYTYDFNFDLPHYKTVGNSDIIYEHSSVYYGIMIALIKPGETIPNDIVLFESSNKDKFKDRKDYYRNTRYHLTTPITTWGSLYPALSCDDTYYYVNEGSYNEKEGRCYVSKNALEFINTTKCDASSLGSTQYSWVSAVSSEDFTSQDYLRIMVKPKENDDSRYIYIVTNITDVAQRALDYMCANDSMYDNDKIPIFTSAYDYYSCHIGLKKYSDLVTTPEDAGW